MQGVIQTLPQYKVTMRTHSLHTGVISSFAVFFGSVPPVVTRDFRKRRSSTTEGLRPHVIITSLQHSSNSVCLGFFVLYRSGKVFTRCAEPSSIPHLGVQISPGSGWWKKKFLSFSKKLLKSGVNYSVTRGIRRG